MANGGQGAVFLVFGTLGGLPGTVAAGGNGVVNLDTLVANGATQPFGTPGTAVEYTGDQSNAGNNGSLANANNATVGSYLGTDVTGGDFNGSGISGYTFGAWAENVGGNYNGTGQIYLYNGTTAYLTQPYVNADNAIYYAGDNPIGAAAMQNGVDLIATGAGNNDWVHGIGLDSTGTQSTTVQHDVVDGGAGNDFVGIVSTNFTSINGGNGWNTLVFEGSNMFLSLAQMGLRVQGFQQFDLNNQSNNTSTDPRGTHQFTGTTTGNTLSISLADVLSEANANVGMTNSATLAQRHVTILGDANSTVSFDGSASLSTTQWAISGGPQTINGVTFNDYHNSAMGSATYADVLIQQGVQVV
jgi:hypothetical protein